MWKVKANDLPGNAVLFLPQSMDGRFVCVALQGQYKIVNYENGQTQELFSYDSEHTKPHVTRISRVSVLCDLDPLIVYHVTSM